MSEPTNDPTRTDAAAPTSASAVGHDTHGPTAAATAAGDLLQTAVPIVSWTDKTSAVPGATGQTIPIHVQGFVLGAPEWATEVEEQDGCIVWTRTWVAGGTVVNIEQVDQLAATVGGEVALRREPMALSVRDEVMTAADAREFAHAVLEACALILGAEK